MKAAGRRVVIGSAAGALAAVLGAIAASACCVGPAVIATLGVGGAIAAAKVGPFRPALLGASYVLLGIGFWRTYFGPTSTAGGACPTRIGRPVRIVLWLAALLTVGATGLILATG